MTKDHLTSALAEASTGPTPGPWSIANTMVIQGQGKDGRLVFVADAYCGIHDRGAANARRIVQCVNAHDELIRIAKSYLDHLEAGAVEQHEAEVVDADFIRAFFARLAIAKAEAA